MAAKQTYIGPDQYAQLKKTLGNSWAQLRGQPTQEDINSSVDSSQMPQNSSSMYAPVPEPMAPSAPQAPQPKPITLVPGKASPSMAAGGPQPFFSNKKQTTNSHENKDISNRNVYLGLQDKENPSLADLVNQYETTAPVIAQRKGMEDLKALQAKTFAGLPTGVDLTPLMALSDAWTGSRFANSYKPPMSGSDKAQLLLKYGEANQKNLQDLTKDELSHISQLKAGNDQSIQTQKLAQLLAATNGVKAPSGNANNPFAQGKYLTGAAGKITDEFLKESTALGAARNAISSGKLNEIKAYTPVMARFVAGDKGQIARNLIEKVVPNTGNLKASEWESFISGNPEVLVDPRISTSMVKIINDSLEEHRNSANSKLTGLEGSASSYLPPEFVKNALSAHHEILDKDAPGSTGSKSKADSAAQAIIEAMKGL